MNCKQCGVAFDGDKRCKFCSAECRVRAYYAGKRVEKACERCGVSFTAAAKQTRFCSNACHLARRTDAVPIRTCVVCGKSFKRNAHGKDAMSCCSRECGFVESGRIRRQRASERSIGKYKPGRYLKVYFYPCSRCGKPFSSRSSTGSKFCSLVCRDFAALVSKSIVDRECKECGGKYTTLMRGSRPASVYCSNRCARAEEKRQRRIREKDRTDTAVHGHITFREVYFRSGGCCYLCGQFAPRRLRGSAHWAEPTIDHVIPLNRGGVHSYENTKIAHRLCNSIKSDLAVWGALDYKAEVDKRLVSVIIDTRGGEDLQVIENKDRAAPSPIFRQNLMV